MSSSAPRTIPPPPPSTSFSHSPRTIPPPPPSTTISHSPRTIPHSPRTIPPPPPPRTIPPPPPSSPIPSKPVSQEIPWSPVTGQYTPPTMVPNVMSIRVPLNGLHDSRMPVVIGSQGSVFKAITYKTRAHYIWWDKQNGEVEVWGFFKNAWDAAARVKERVDMVRNLPCSKVVSVPIVQLPKSSEEFAIPTGIKWGDLPEDA